MAAMGWILLALLAAGAVVWSALALHYTAPWPRLVRDALAGLALAAPLAAGLALDSLPAAVITAAIVLALVLAWFLWLAPPQVDDWQQTVAKLPQAALVGDTLTVHNLRNFEYRSRTDYTPHWETRSYDLSQLVGLDMFFSHWSGPTIAHTILSWSFADGRHLAISVEARYRVGQKYSAVAGFFRQYPIYYVVADERDVIRLRTSHRGEHVWLYRLNVGAEAARSLLLEYIESVNRLAQRPAWYNALTGNCTTAIRSHVRHLNPDDNLWHWQLLANGYLPELLYEQSRLDRTLPFDRLREISNIDARAKAAADEDFSQAIRVGLPNPSAAESQSALRRESSRPGGYSEPSQDEAL